MSKAFISYNHNNEPFVRELYHRLKRDGVECFFDKESIPWGDNWVVHVSKGLDECDFLVLILTPEFCASQWTQLEQTAFMADDPGVLKKKIQPLLLKECKDLLPRLLDLIQVIDVSSDDKFEMNYPSIFRGLGGVSKKDEESTSPAASAGASKIGDLEKGPSTQVAPSNRKKDSEINDSTQLPPYLTIIESEVGDTTQLAPSSQREDSEPAKMTDHWRDNPDLKAVQTKLRKYYEVEDRIGGGGFSNVYLINLYDRKEALKVMDISHIQSGLKNRSATERNKIIAEIKERFKNEGKFYVKNKHPNIVDVQTIGIAEDENRKIEIPYILMSYIKGSTLEQYLDLHGRLKWERALEISQKILEVLTFIHERTVIHRDIKPANIMIEDDTGKPVLIDFGLAKDILEDASITKFGGHFGTPHYMSPEQWDGIKDLTPASDIYSFGVVLYKMLSGELPFDGKNQREIMHGHCSKAVPDIRQKIPQLPPGIEDVLFKAIAKKAEDRFKSARDFWMALEEIEKKRNQTIAIDTGKGLGPTIQRRINPRYLLLIIIIIGAMVGGSIYLGRNQNQSISVAAKSRAKDPKVTAVQKQDDFKIHIDAAKALIASGNLQKAREEVDAAQKIKNDPEIDECLNLITAKQIGEMIKDFETLKKQWQKNVIVDDKLKGCQEFMTKHRDVPKNSETQPIFEAINNSIKKFEIEVNDGLYKKCIIQGDGQFQVGQYDRALNEYKQAQKIKDTEEVRAALTRVLEKQREVGDAKEINGEKEFNRIKVSVNRTQYLEFKSKYPKSNHLPDLGNQVKDADKNLPPEKYWDKSIKADPKGYYEYTFGSVENPHIMIYIPARNIWVDKYEVSWKQYRGYLKEQGKVVPPIKENKSKPETDEFPATITFEDAAQYGKEYGLRLPNENEWEYVAGKGQFLFPWGNESLDEGGVYRANNETFEDGYPGTAPVKSFEKFSSPFGVVNMVGNVWEWCIGRILKGGGYLSEKEDITINKKNTGKQGDTWGFRCIKEEK